jgi:predicted kinase
MTKRKNPNHIPKPVATLEFIVLVAPQCAGKSTFTKQAKYKDYLVASIDEEIMAQHPDLSYTEAYRQCNFAAVEKAFKRKFLEEVSKKERSIIIDKTNMTSKSRRKLLATVPPVYKKIAVLFNWDVDVLKQRSRERCISEGKCISDKVIDETVDKFVPIQACEGFDTIITLR